jgi:gas vesicle protein
VTERQHLITGGVVGALAGVAVGWLFFTESGRRWRQDPEGGWPAILNDVEALLAAVDQIRQSATRLATEPRSGWPRSA